MQAFSRTTLAIVLLLLAPVTRSDAGPQEAVPLPISPGSPNAAAEIDSHCPTFSWSGVRTASGYELAVFEVAGGEDVEGRPVVRHRIGGDARSWTPASNLCLDPGKSYAWSLRALSESGDGEWSSARRFRVSGAPSIEEIDRAIETLRRYVEGSGAGDGGASRGAAAGLDDASRSQSRAPQDRRRRPGRKPPGPGPTAAPKTSAAPITVPSDPALTIDGAFDLGGPVIRNGEFLLHTAQDAFGTNPGNIAVGLGSLASNTAGDGNTALGYEALYSNTSGLRNVAIGYYALRNSDDHGNVAVGAHALQDAVDGANTAIGSYALYNNSAGGSNTAIGYRAMELTEGGTHNTAVGIFALDQATGFNNVAIGYAAGSSLQSGDENIFIGAEQAGLSNSTMSGTIVLGEAGTHDTTYIAGIHGGSTDFGLAVYVDHYGRLGTSSSSRRFKQDVQDMGDLTERLLSLRPVTFTRPANRDRHTSGTSSPGERPTEYGLIAEEVATVFPDLVAEDDQGRPYTVRYHLLIPMLLKELQDQHERNATLADEIEALRRRLERLEEP